MCGQTEQDDRVDLKFKKKKERKNCSSCQRSHIARFLNAYASYDSSPTEKVVH